MALQEILNKHYVDGWPDKGDPHSYVDLYAQLFELRRFTAKNILEIGVLSGQSIKMWDEYFGGDVYGIDYTLTPLDKYNLQPLIDEGYKIKIFDATNPHEAKKHFEGIKFDIIIDDAQHSIEQQVELFNLWRNYITEGGLYIIEDIQNLDETRKIFESLASGLKTEIFDLRSVKGRYDDAMVVIHF